MAVLEKPPVRASRALAPTAVLVSAAINSEAGATTVRILPGQNLTEIAASYGISKQRVGEIRRQAVEKLRLDLAERGN